MVQLVVESLEQQGDENALQLLQLLALLPASGSGVSTCLLDEVVDGRYVDGMWAGGWGEGFGWLVRKVEREGEGGVLVMHALVQDAVEGVW